MSNPFRHAQSTAEAAADEYALDVAEVLSVPSDDGHTVRVQVSTPTVDSENKGSPSKVSALVPSTGDVALPSKGDLVALGYFKSADGSKTPIVLGALYSAGDENVPAYDAADRVLGSIKHSSEIRIDSDGTIALTHEHGSEVRLKENGDVEVNSVDGNVIIDGGGVGAIYDVSTSTDADGHVTGITLHRSSTVKIPNS